MNPNNENTESSESTWNWLKGNEPVDMMADILGNKTDASKLFLHTMGVSVLSTLLGRLVFANGIEPLSNYYLLVGRSMFARKSTVQKFATDIIIAVSKKLPPIKYESIDHYRYSIMTSGSAEGIETILRVPGSTLLFAPDEYKKIIDISNRSNQSGFIRALTEMYTQKSIHVALRGSQMKVSDYSFNILGISTPTWIEDIFQKHHVAGGFVNRHFIALSTDISVSYKNSAPLLEEELDLISNKLIELIPDKKVSIAFNPASEKLYQEYMESRNRKLSGQSDDVIDLVCREGVHTLKLAALRSYCNKQPHIQKDDIEYAIRLSEMSSQAILTLAKVQYESPTNLDADEIKMLKFIFATLNKTSNPINRSAIGRHFGGKQDHNKLIINQLIAKGYVVQTEDGALLPTLPKSDLGKLFASI